MGSVHSIGVRDLALDPVSGDLAHGGGLLSIVSGTDVVAQRLRLRLGLWLGEWFLNALVGVPWPQWIGSKPDLKTIESVLRRAITTAPGIASLDVFSLSLDGASRALNVSFRATAVTGEVIDVTDFQPGSP